MARNDDKNDKAAPASAVPQPEGENRVMAGAPQSPERDRGTDHAKGVDEPTAAVGTILVDASEATKATDGDLYQAYIGVDEDRKRLPATDAQRPYWGEGEQEAIREAAENHDTRALQRTVAERRADSEVAAERHQAEVDQLKDERKSQNQG